MSSPSPGPRPTNVRWVVVALLMGFTFLAHFNRVSITVAGKAHFIGPDRLSETEMGFVYSAFLLVYTIGMIPGGWLIDRVGPRWTMAVMGVGFGTCTVLTGALGWAGLAVSAMLLPLLLIRGVAGASSVPLHPGAARTVSLWTPLRDRSTANGLVNAGALVGIAVTYPGFGRLMDAVGWPSAFVISGAALAALGLFWFALAADSPAAHPWSNAAERDLVADAGVPPRTRATARQVLRLFGNRGLVLLTISYGMLGYMQYMFFYWVEYYFGTVLKLPDTESRAAAFTVTIAMAMGMAVGGWASDRLCRRLGFARGCRVMGLAGMGLCAAFSLLGVNATEPRAVVVFFSLAMGSLGLCEGVFWSTAPALEPRNGGLACAVLNTGGNGVGMLAPVVTPVVGLHYGWDAAVVVACGVCAAGGLLWLGIGPPSPRSQGDGGTAIPS